MDAIIEMDLTTNAKRIPGVLRPKSSVIIYGTGAEATIPAFANLANSLMLAFFFVYQLDAQRDRAANGINQMLEEGKLSSRIGLTFPLADTAAAHEAVERGTIRNALFGQSKDQGEDKLKAYELQGPGGVDEMRLVEKPDPTPGPGQVLVKLKAATINYRDLLTVKGGYGSRQKFPLVPLSDGAGVVESVGAGVAAFKPGDRVTGSFFEGWLGGEPSETKMRTNLGGAFDGVLCEYRVWPAAALVRTPEHLTDVEAASLPCAGLTAWSAVVKLGNIRPGQTVLTQGTGGVSIFALQFAKMSGARVIATSSSEAKIEKLKALGADITINYKTTPEWGKLARQATGHGVDLVVEVGGVGTLNESIRATRIGGSIAFIGVLAGRPESESRLPLMVMQQQRLQGVTVGSVEDLQAMADAIAVNGMKPVMDRTFPFTEARAAFAHMASGAHFGKVAVEMG